MPEPEISGEEVAKGAEKAYGEWFTTYTKLFGRRLFEWMIVYFFGYYNASFGWLMAPLFFLVLREKRAKEKKTKFDFIKSIADSDEKDILQAIHKVSALPSWVTFPDMERVEWLNKIVKQLWPYAGQYARDLCKDTLEGCIGDALKEYKISGFKFEKIILGDTPPRFSGMKVYDDTSRHEIILDTDFIYAGDCKFEVAVSKIKAGIKDLQISGRIRVVMKPLVRQIPLVGGLQVFFLNNPEVDFNLIGVADFLDMPGLSDILRSIVVEQIAAMMVLPNRYPIQLVENINIVELKCPVPAGVIRIQVVEASNLMKMDIGMLGTGKSDPYCILHLGAQKFQTKTINNTVSPKWDFCCEFISEVARGQEIQFEVFDLDDADRDDTIGRANLDVQSIYNHGEIDEWVPLSEAKSGRIHIRATWLELSSDPASLDAQLVEIRALQKNTKNPLHSAVVLVWVDSASQLHSIPDPFVRLHVGNSTKETTPRLRTNDPVWEEGFTFLVRNPKTQELKLEVVDSKTNGVQGKVEMDLNMLMKNKDMEAVGETYSLMGSSGGLATIKLTITMRMLNVSSKTNEGNNEIGEPVSSPESKSSPLTDPPTKVKPKEPIPSQTQSQSSPRKSTSESPEQPKVAAPPIDTQTNTSDSKFGEQERKISTVSAIEEMIQSPVIPLIPQAVHIDPSESVLRQRNVPVAEDYNLGRVQLTVKYGPRNKLIIVVHQIDNLPVEDDGEIPDPYVKLYLLPDRSKDSKRKTDVIKDSCNPVYDERFEYDVDSNELTDKTLEVSVINKKGLFHLQRSNVMGQVLLDCGLLDPNKVTQWYNLAPGRDDDED